MNSPQLSCFRSVVFEPFSDFYSELRGNLMKYLYIFRHGETDWNKEKRSQGWLGVPLNNTGIAQANDLAKIIEPIELDVIYSSPLPRALETAEIVARSANTKIIIHDGLKERNKGVLNGHLVRKTDNPEEELLDFLQDLIVMPAKLMRDPDFRPENGESWNDLAKRSYATILDIAKKSEGSKIGISTHGGTARSIISQIIGQDVPTGSMKNGTYCRLDWDGEKLSLNEFPEWLTLALMIKNKAYIS